MQNLCSCCRRLLALPPKPPVLEQLQSLRLEDIPENTRLELTEEVIQRMLQPKSEPTSGLCSICSQIGCDGITSCRMPTEQWAVLEDMEAKGRAADQAWAVVTLLEEQWLQKQGNNFSDNEQRTTDTWISITDYYWRKETITSTRGIIAEILQVEGSGGYLTRIRVTEHPNVQTSEGGTISWGLPTLEAAQTHCEEEIIILATEEPIYQVHTFILFPISEPPSGS